jgi:hypothetical protein
MVDDLHLLGGSRLEQSGVGMIWRLGVSLNKEVVVAEMHSLGWILGVMGGGGVVVCLHGRRKSGGFLYGDG